MRYLLIIFICIIIHESCTDQIETFPENETIDFSCSGIPDCLPGQDTVLVSIDTLSTNSLGLECTLNFDREEDLNFVINSISEYQSIVNCADTLPATDFSTCTLLAGQIYVHWCCAAKLIEQQVVKNCKDQLYTHRVIIHEPIDQFTSMNTLYYFAWIPKIENGFNVEFDVEVKLAEH